MAELKPCPFCGDSSPYIHGDEYYWVQCFSCGAETQGDEDISVAIERWNRRADND